MPVNQPFNAGVLTRNVTKTTDEDLAIIADWNDSLDSADVIDLSSWSVDDAAVTLSGATLSDGVSSVIASGGDAGTVYVITNTLEVSTIYGSEQVQTQFQLLVKSV